MLTCGGGVASFVSKSAHVKSLKYKIFLMLVSSTCMNDMFCKVSRLKPF